MWKSKFQYHSKTLLELKVKSGSNTFWTCPHIPRPCGLQVWVNLMIFPFSYQTKTHNNTDNKRHQGAVAFLAKNPTHPRVKW